MKTISILLIKIIFCAGLLSAQNVYKIPSGSQDNTISISVKNPGITPITEVIVSVGDKPVWLKFENSSVTLRNVEKDAAVNAVFKFNIESDAPLDTESEILFNIKSSSGQSWLKKIKFTVTVPQKFELLQNYPNPFNPTTKIHYSVPADGFVNIVVYNVLGEKVANLVNTNVKAGIYDISFDATNIASGMYIYRMESGDFVSIKKMMILK